MLKKMTTLQFIKKSRPKLKQGDVFYYLINNKYYLGTVLLTQLDRDIKDNTAIVVLLTNYSIEDIHDFSIEKLHKKIEELSLIAPPTLINKKAWNLGYFVNLTNVNYLNKEILNLLRFECWDHLCDYQYNPSYNIPELKLFGSSGIYGYEGIEYIIQIGLGLFYDNNEKPYKYYEDSDFKKYIKNNKLPYWYYNAIGQTEVIP
ncbi:hypothetical protein [Pasteurella sp. PK-2025]|uniref:hypothetical protein n=1 Tax=Pasteurella sp. PK-2025 TaxID=3413133 RepID=UPI003C75AFE6